MSIKLYKFYIYEQIIIYIWILKHKICYIIKNIKISLYLVFTYLYFSSYI